MAAFVLLRAVCGGCVRYILADAIVVCMYVETTAQALWIFTTTTRAVALLWSISFFLYQVLRFQIMITETDMGDMDMGTAPRGLVAWERIFTLLFSFPMAPPAPRHLNGSRPCWWRCGEYEQLYSYEPEAGSFSEAAGSFRCLTKARLATLLSPRQHNYRLGYHS